VAASAQGGCIVTLREPEAAELGLPAAGPAAGLATAAWRGRASVSLSVPAAEAAARAGVLRRAMAKAGIDVAVVFGMSASRVGVHTPNSFVADFCSKLSTPTVPFCSIDPSDSNWREQLEEAVELGFKGIGEIYPVLALFDPTDSAFDDFYQFLDRHGMVVLWHMGATPSPEGRLSYSQPLVVEEVARRYPDLKQVIAHMGHPWQRDTNLVLRKHRNVYADVSALWHRPMDGFLALVHSQEWGVTHKLLFGSDYPLWEPVDAIERFRALADLRAGNLPYVLEETVESIIHRDSLALLGIPDPRQAR
jgi:predicted TIM-barrel fold metal-dependent hydrolase